jgi:peptidoglycan/xylan/chitin deacetylase (PgdA/CDA1 family)
MVPKGRALVLRYHRILQCGIRNAERGTGGQSAIPLALPADEFDAQLAFLASHCQVVAGSQIAQAAAEGHDLPPDAVAITFDDGYEDNCSQALPLLQHHGLRATFFVTAGWVGTEKVLWWDRLHDYIRQAAELGARPMDYQDLPKPLAAALAGADLRSPAGAAQLEHALAAALGSLPLQPEETDNLVERVAAALGADVADPEPYRPMSWDQVRQLHAAGMEIGSHTMRHARLAHVPVERVFEDLEQSKQTIEREVGAPVSLLAYPAGSHNQDVVDLAVEAGYQAAFTTDGGSVAPGDDPFRLRRIGVWAGGYAGPSSRFSPSVFGLQLGRLGRRPTEHA